MLLELRQAGGRINRYRNATSQQDAVKTSEKVAAGWQHERYGLPWLERLCLKARCHRCSTVVEGRIGDLFEMLVGAVQGNVGALRVETCVPVEDFNEGGGSRRHPIGSSEHSTVDIRGH